MRITPAPILALVALAVLVALPTDGAAQATSEKQAAFEWDASDPRIGLAPGYQDAAEAAGNMRLLANLPRTEGFYNPDSPGDLDFANSDLAFQGDLVFLGNFNGFQIYDISDPDNPRLRTAVICSGGQGDLSVYGNLLFMSVEQTRGRLDCGPQGVAEPVSTERFRGVRIFDISDLDNPRQIAAVQTCRGSHTHTLVPDPNDPDNLYVYVSGTSRVRPAEELAGCSAASPDEDPNTSLFRIEVIQVPLSSPQDARVIAEPRIFADHETGNIAGLWKGGDHGEGTQRTSQTNQCHDITAYPEIGLAAGACSGNGILLDIRDPANPVRISEVTDPNFAYWHSATFSNDGRTVIFTDEWGGGTQARCRATDPLEWGGNAIFTLADGNLELESYYKLPVPQTATENCVAHNGSLIPVPGRDIKVQAWYQGGVSVFDFTDPANPYEIAYFDRGPIDDERLHVGGYWSAYWYNGRIYGAEIARGLDIFELTPSEHLTQNEIDAAKLVILDEFNPQNQPRMRWPAAFVVARAYIDQLVRGGAVSAERGASLARELDRIEAMPQGSDRDAALARLANLAPMMENAAQAARDAERAIDALRLEALAGVLQSMGRAD